MKKIDLVKMNFNSGQNIFRRSSIGLLLERIDELERSKKNEFYSGILTALHLLDMHGQDTIYDELVNLCNLKELVSYSVIDGEFDWSGLSKRDYARKVKP